MFDAPLTQSDINPDIVLAVFATLSGASFAYAVVMAGRLRDAVPVLVCIGALVCALNEPIYDILGKITYADDHVMAYTAFGREIPLFLVLGYLPWVGLLPWVLSRMMAAGISRTRLHVIAAFTFLSVVVVETLGTTLEAWTYYGEPPMKYLGVAPQAMAFPILGGFLLYALARWATGWRRLLLIFVPTLILPTVYAAGSWPMYVANYADVGPAVEWLSAATSMFILVLVLVSTTAAVARWQTAERSGVWSARGRGPTKAAARPDRDSAVLVGGGSRV